jgi:hypothetical protein
MLGASDTMRWGDDDVLAWTEVDAMNKHNRLNTNLFIDPSLDGISG